MAMIESVGVKRIYDNNSFVFRIYIKNNNCVYMRVDESPFYNNERYVIIVSAIDFYKKWMKMENKKIDRDICIAVTDDEKYKDAGNGFSRGIDDPVPLAIVGYDKCIGFTNGITRTKWLLNNGAMCFPVECSKTSAVNFYNTLSYENREALSVEELMKTGPCT
jgi:hypothetical protein